MSRWRAEVDRASPGTRDQIESEPVVVAEGIDVTLAGLRELRRRIDLQCVEAGDWPVLKALVWELMTEARERGIVAITVDDDEPDESKSGAFATETSAPSLVEPQSLGGARRRG